MKKLIILFLILSFVPSFAWDILRNQKGTMTGYSTPITNNVFNDLGIDLNNKKQRLKSPNVMTDLFSAPQKNYDYTINNGYKQTQGGGVGAQTGVTIIYD